jgi:hypothetical protein
LTLSNNVQAQRPAQAGQQPVCAPAEPVPPAPLHAAGSPPPGRPPRPWPRRRSRRPRGSAGPPLLTPLLLTQLTLHQHIHHGPPQVTCYHMTSGLWVEASVHYMKGLFTGHKWGSLSRDYSYRGGGGGFRRPKSRGQAMIGILPSLAG